MLIPTPGKAYTIHRTDHVDIVPLESECYIRSGSQVLVLEREVRSTSSSGKTKPTVKVKVLLGSGMVGTVFLYDNLYIYWDDHPESVWLEEV